ncbi:aspartate aminotransferase family protein [Acetobacteraceae bacterium H6797]|nr:aspartate aminotransferase family protein [Acetobacteraceae bacterium H6797]
MSPTVTANADLDTAVAEARGAYVAARPKSKALHEEAAKVLPGGNTRTVLFYEPFPTVMERGAGARLWDVEGHEYLDLLGEFTAGIYGHSDPTIRAAIDGALDNGVNLASHGANEPKLARLLLERFPSLERVRFTNSGTEANLMALALATAFTGRRQVMVFAGGYHGGVLTFGGGTGGKVNVPHDIVLAPYNDAETSVRMIREAGDKLAAVLVEPMLGSGGCIPGEAAFLQALRATTRETGALLILDEVMTSRLGPGGRQAALGVVPDLTTLGKYIGGGMSVGAFGGRADIMDLFDPRRPDALPHAGTFNNNVLTMAAGVAGLSKVFTPEVSLALNARGDRLRERLNALGEARGAAFQATGLGSLLTLHPMRGPIRTPADAAKADSRLRDLLFFELMARGYYLARRGMIALSLPVTDAELDGLVEAVGDILDTHRTLFTA